MYNISYANEIHLPIPERKQKGVNYISTSLKDIENDEFLRFRFEQAQAKASDTDVVIDNRGMKFDRSNRNTLKINMLSKAITDTVLKGKDVEPLIRQFVAVDLGCMQADDVVRIVEYLSCQFQDNIEALAKLMSAMLGLLIPFKGALFKDVHKIVFYVGMLNKEYAILLHTLSNLGYDVVYVNNFVSDSEYRYSWIRKPVVEFHSQNTGLEVNDTLSYTAQQEIRQILDDNLVRRENKVDEELIVKPLRCTVDEIKQYMHEGLKFRPHFEKSDNSISIPNIVAVLQGWNCSYQDYMKEWLIPLAKDTEFTLFYRCLFSFSVSQDMNYMKLLTRNDITFPKLEELHLGNYDLLKPEIRQHILTYINKKFKTLRTKTEMLNFLYRVLNLPKSVIEMYNNFILTERNPKMVYVMFGEDDFSESDTILRDLLINTGWDVLILSPEGCLPIQGIPIYSIGQVRKIDTQEKQEYIQERNFFTKTKYTLNTLFSNNSEMRVQRLSEMM